MADEELEKKAEESEDEESSEDESSAESESESDQDELPPPSEKKPAKAEKKAEKPAKAEPKADDADDAEDEAPAAAAKDKSTEEDDEIDAALAAQTSNVLGAERFVYAAYLAGAVAVAFIFSKIGHAIWAKLASWKPEQIPEVHDEYLYLPAGLLGVGMAVYYWRKKESREYATEVADELSKVTWPTKKEVQTSTLVVVMTTLFATVFFALMDQFWRFVTDKVYGF